MTYKAKLTIKFDSEWEPTRGIYDEDMIPEQHLTMECPIEDWSTTQIFQTFSNFMMAMGHNELGIMKGACSVAFNEFRSQEQMRKIAEEYDLIIAEDLSGIVEDRLKQEKEWSEQNKPEPDVWEKRYYEYAKLAEAEIRKLKAKISRLENPDNPQYTEQEMEAMCSEAEERDKSELIKRLSGAYCVCHDCGKKYGEYSVGCSSTWQGKCNVCGQEKPVTEARDYGYMSKGVKELLENE
jgi:hypothetical protein